MENFDFLEHFIFFELAGISKVKSVIPVESLKREASEKEKNK